MDPWLPERLRRLAVVVRGERDIEAATRAAYADLLALIAADVLDDVAVVAAVPDPGRNRNQVNAAWLALLLRVKKPIDALFRKRRRKAGARAAYENADADKYLAGVTEHLKGVPDEVYKDLRMVVADGIKAGLTEDEIRARLAAELTPGHPEYEARLDDVASRVARTQSISAFNAGDEAGWTDVATTSGGGITKRWLSSHDTKVRRTHAEADVDPDNQAVPIGRNFNVGGYPARYPGDWTLPPEEAVNCRCTAVYSHPIVGAVVTTPTLPNGYRGPIAALDILTGDDRMLMTPDGGVRTREYPLSLTLGHVGDGEAPVIGSVDRVWVQDGLVYGEGKIDLGGDAGHEFARQLTEGYINTVSIHPDEVTAELRMYDPNGKLVADPQAVYEENDYSIPEGYTEVLAFTDWRLAGLAAVPIPAYTEARIEGVYDYIASGPQAGDALVAGVGGQIFHREFFTAVATGPTPMTVTPDGHIFGHVREKGTCYQYGGGVGDGGFCVEPPRSACNYAKFMVHGARMEDGEILAVGALTYGDGHESRGGLVASRSHYNDVATIAAKVVARDDEWGVWITGEVLDAHRERAYDLLLSPLSGHWEPDADNDGYLEMLAAHIVVTPGYNVKRLVASFDGAGRATSIIITNKPRIRAQVGAVSGRALVAAAMADQRRASRLARRAGVDIQSRARRALERINS